MLPPGERAQHSLRPLRRAGLSEHLAVQLHERVGGERPEQAVLDRVDERVEVAALERGVADPAGKERVAAEEHRLVGELEAHRSGGVAGCEHRVEAESADLDHVVVGEDLVVAGQHGGVLGGDVHGVPGVAQLRHGLDVVPVAVGLEDLLDVQRPAQLEQAIVLVRRVEQHGIAGLLAPQHVHVVLERPDHHHVDLGVSIRPDQRVAHRPILP